MAKAGMKRPDADGNAPKNPQQKVTEIQGKAKTGNKKAGNIQENSK